MPCLMPPPASTTLNTRGQWSRPASPLILGVRPNSLETITIVSVEHPACGPGRGSRRQRPCPAAASPAACRRRSPRGNPSRRRSATTTRTPAAIRRRAISIRCPAWLRPYSSRIAAGSASMIEGLAGLGRADQAVGPLVERVHGLQASDFSSCGEMVVHRVQHVRRRAKRASSIAARQGSDRGP